MSLLSHLATLPVPPLLTPSTSVLASSLFTISYVASLYLFPATRIDGVRVGEDGQQLTRDSPLVIRARVKAACVSSVVCAGGVWACFWAKGSFQGLSLPQQLLTTLQLLGLPLPFTLSPSFALTASIGALLRNLLATCFVPLGLTVTLYLGPLYVSFLEGTLPGQRRLEWRETVREMFGSLVGRRNYIFGPLTEEVVFRACIVAVTHYAGVGHVKTVFLTPLYFGIAHAHHAWETYVRSGRTREGLVRGLVSSGFHFSYTTLFGWYAAFLFMRTGTLLAPFLSHSFCNLMGLPDLGGAELMFPKQKKVIQAAYVLGILLFARLLAPATSPALFGGSVYWR